MAGIGELNWSPGIQAIDTLADLLEGTSEAAEHLVRKSNHQNADCLSPELQAFAAATRLAATQLACFPDAAKWFLVVIQQDAELGPSLGQNGDDLDLLRAVCTNLRVLAAASATLLKSERGPCSSTAQMLAVLRLKQLYECLTGDEVTHSSHTGGDYTGGARSPFAKFVETAFDVMEPNAPLRRGLISAVSFAVWPSRASGAGSKVELERADFERRTRDALARARM